MGLEFHVKFSIWLHGLINQNLVRLVKKIVWIKKKDSFTAVLFIKIS